MRTPAWRSRSRADSRGDRRGNQRSAPGTARGSGSRGPVAGVYEKDSEEIRTNIAAAFAGPLSGSRVAARPVDVRFVNGDTAVVVSEDGIIFPGQDAVASERLVRATWVLVRRDGGWRIASYHNSPAS
jgi:uncharacterized protein (TIGR02246 family)